MTFGRGLRALSIASAVLITGAFALVFFYAPNDADQGFIQKIFYVHVPLAIVALCGFVAGGIYGILHLRSGDRAHDLRSYVAIHISLDPRRRRADHRQHLGARGVGPLVGLGRADARVVPDRLPALRVLPAAALLDRGPRAPGALRVGVRDRRGRVRAAELHRGADGRVAHAPARAEHDGRRDAGRDAADVPRRAGRDGVPVRDAVEVRAGRRSRPRCSCARSSAGSPATTAWRRSTRSAAPQQL